MLGPADANAACAFPFFATFHRLDSGIKLAKTFEPACIFKNVAVRLSLFGISNRNTTEFRNPHNYQENQQHSIF
jgi:hypothetical protein